MVAGFVAFQSSMKNQESQAKESNRASQEGHELEPRKAAQKFHGHVPNDSCRNQREHHELKDSGINVRRVKGEEEQGIAVIFGHFLNRSKPKDEAVRNDSNRGEH